MASERERREMLLVRKDAVRAFFERTAVRGPARGGSSWLEAFQAVQKNDYLAEALVEERRALIECIETEFGVTANAPPFDEEATVINAPPERSSRGEVPQRIVDDGESAVTSRHKRPPPPP